MGQGKHFRGGEKDRPVGPLVVQEYETVENLNGVKILVNPETPNRGSLPRFSKEPNEVYAYRNRQTGEIQQMAIYGADRIRVADIDFGHTHHGHGSPHAHDIPHLGTNARELTQAEREIIKKVR